MTFGRLPDGFASPDNACRMARAHPDGPAALPGNPVDARCMKQSVEMVI